MNFSLINNRNNNQEQAIYNPLEVHHDTTAHLHK